MLAVQSVAIYVRVSTREQVDAFSLDGQEAALRNDAKARGKQVVKVYSDAGASGAKEDRPALMQMMADAKQGKFQEVLVWSVSRLSRKLSHLLSLVELLTSYGISVRSLSEKFDASTPVGQFILSTMGAISEMQRSSWMESSRIGMKKRAASGRTNGIYALGYQSVPDASDARGGNMLEIVPDEAETVRLIYTLYDHGNGYKAVAFRLNEMGKTGKTGKPFAACTIKLILTNPAYIGKVKFDGQMQDGLHESIIPIELWDRVQQRVKDCSRPVQKVIDRLPLLSGLIRCPLCGWGMVPAHTKKRRKDGSFLVTHYYACSQYQNKGKAVCRANSVRADKAEEKVLAWLTEILTSPFWSKRIIEEVRLRQCGEYAYGADQKALQQELMKVEKELKRVLVRYEDGLIGKETFLTEAAVLKDKKQELVGKLATFDSKESQPVWDPDAIRTAFAQFRRVLQVASMSKIRDLIHALVESIEVNDKREVIKLSIRTPLLQADEATSALVIPVGEAK